MKLALFKALPDDIIGVVWDMLDNDAKIMLNREFFSDTIMYAIIRCQFIISMVMIVL